MRILLSVIHVGCSQLIVLHHIVHVRCTVTACHACTSTLDAWTWSLVQYSFENGMIRWEVKRTKQAGAGGTPARPVKLAWPVQAKEKCEFSFTFKTRMLERMSTLIRL